MSGKWRKVGEARLSRSGKFILLSVDETEPKEWVLVSVEEVLMVITRRLAYAALFVGAGDLENT